jgi:hypothetical protein
MTSKEAPRPAGEPADVARLRAALASVRGDGQSPVDAERIFDALHGRLTVEERQAVVEELLSNPDAAEAWRLARELAVDSPARVTPLRTRLRWFAAAAVVVLAAGAAWRYTQPASDPVYRGSETRAVVSALPADAVLPRAQPVLRWRSVEGARYRVRVLTPELELLEESAESPALEHTVGPAVLQRVPPDGRILWQVEARVPDGGTVVSPTFSARIE